MQKWMQFLEKEAKSMQAFLSSTRRSLHRNPELSMREFQTTQFLIDKLNEVGISARSTSKGVGLVCDVSNDAPESSGPCVGIRSDIDALPIQTNSTADYASCNPGVMHACGHDAHATMALGATLLIHRLVAMSVIPWPVHVRTIFQPAEETGEGGVLVVDEGWLENLKSVFALHVDPALESGVVATRGGSVMAGSTSFTVSIIGLSGHSARPYLGIDALAAGTQFIQQCYAMIPRTFDCRESAVIHFGTFGSGTAANVVSDLATLTGTLRSFQDSLSTRILDKMRDIGQAIAMSFGCRLEISIQKSIPALQNDSTLASKLLSLCKALPLVEKVLEIAIPSMGAEDFAFITEKVPGCLLRVGSGSGDGLTMRHPLHSSYFDIDEKVLAIGSVVLAAAAIAECVPKEGE